MYLFFKLCFIFIQLKQLLSSAGSIVVKTVKTVIKTRRTVRAIVTENLKCVGTAVVKARNGVLEARAEAIECAGAVGPSVAKNIEVLQ